MIHAEGAVELLLDASIAAQDQEQDSNFLIVGKEGIGKSTFMLHCVGYIDNIKGYLTPIEYIARDISEYVTALSDSLKERVVCLDEGRKLSSLRTMETLSKDLADAFTIMRKKKLITFICFTNPLKIQNYYKEDRTLGMFLIPKRGIVYFYRKNQLDDIHRELIKVRSIKEIVKHFKPSIIDYFPDYKGRLRDAYDKRKDEGIDQALLDLKEKYSTKEKVYSLRQAAKYIDMPINALKKFVEEDKIDYEMNALGNIYRFKEKELNTFKQNLNKTNKRVTKDSNVTDTEYIGSKI